MLKERAMNIGLSFADAMIVSGASTNGASGANH
jgi:hypothetical protein